MATETLTCQKCGEDFTREVKRGRKPKQCPACKGQVEKPKVRGRKKRASGKNATCAKGLHIMCNDMLRKTGHPIYANCECECHEGDTIEV